MPFGEHADGLAFVIQNNSSTALGGVGFGIGYGRSDRGTVGIPNSLAVEFDMFYNRDLNDPVSYHISVQTRGMPPNDPDAAYSLGTTTAVPALTTSFSPSSRAGSGRS